MKTEFVSHVSHELRTPLSSIKAYAELLVDGEASDVKTPERVFTTSIQAEAERLSRLIEQHIEYNADRGGDDLAGDAEDRCRWNEVLKQVLEVVMPSAREKEITLVDSVTQVFLGDRSGPGHDLPGGVEPGVGTW